MQKEYALRLFIAGASPLSNRALVNLRRICEKYLKDRYDLEVIDIYQQPKLAREANILATPTLIRVLPVPVRRIIGDFSNLQRVLAALELQEEQ
ncbi:MAG: circadian clock KaiB family protein [Candidatus Riflebacteria bacterium]|nr:circadian clock KaiB family protein [Candidatus Riflebacteria bacterium]